MEDGEVNRIPESIADPIDGPVTFLEQEVFFKSLIETRASNDTLRAAGHVLIDHAMDEMGIPRPPGKTSFIYQIRKYLRF
jgi:hypothetical protein